MLAAALTSALGTEIATRILEEICRRKRIKSFLSSIIEELWILFLLIYA